MSDRGPASGSATTQHAEKNHAEKTGQSEDPRATGDGVFRIFGEREQDSDGDEIERWEPEVLLAQHGKPSSMPRAHGSARLLCRFEIKGEQEAKEEKQEADRAAGV